MLLLVENFYSIQLSVKTHIHLYFSRNVSFSMNLEWTRRPFWQEQLVLVKCAQESYQFERDLLKQLQVKTCELYFLFCFIESQLLLLYGVLFSRLSVSH